MIDIKDIKKIQNIFSGSDIGEIEIRHGKDALRMTISHAKKKLRTNRVKPPAPPKAADPSPADPGIYELHSKWIGFFTRLNSKTGENYIKLRDVVKKGDIVGHVRVLGVLQDITSEVNGKVKEVLVEEGQPIEYGQPVMRFEIEH